MRHRQPRFAPPKRVTEQDIIKERLKAQIRAESNALAKGASTLEANKAAAQAAADFDTKLKEEVIANSEPQARPWFKNPVVWAGAGLLGIILLRRG